MTTDFSFDDAPRAEEAPVVQFPRTASTRTLPQNPDAEAALLGCVFVDAPEVLAKCRDANVSHDSFSDPQNAAIMRAMLRLDDARQPVDTVTVAEELKQSPAFKGGNVYVKLTSLESVTATTAQAEYLIAKVREVATLRAIIRHAADVSERCYGFSGSIDTLADEILTDLRHVIDTTAPGRFERPRPLTDFGLVPDNDPTVLLGDRYLNRGDGAVLVGTSGIGKSSIAIQKAVLWALGRDAFGIKPNGPLRSLIIQAEDSDGDIAEVKESIFHVLKLTPEERATIGKRVCILNDRTNRGKKFFAAARRAINEFKPDLVWMNPLQAFMDGDVTDSQDLGAFLREGVNGLNTPPAYGMIIVHHTTKPATGKDRSDRLWHEVMYDMAGGAEIINWARAILSLRPAKEEGEFNLVLAKRGRRAGVTVKITDEFGLKEQYKIITTIPLRHATGTIPPTPPHRKPLPVIFWEGREADPKEEKESESEKLAKKAQEYKWSELRSVFPAPNEQPKRRADLLRAANTIRPLKGDDLFYQVLKNFEEIGCIQHATMEGGGMGYRRVM